MSLLKAAQEALQAGDPAGALAHGREILSTSPGSYNAAVICGKACFALNHDVVECEKYYRMAVATDPHKIPAHQGLAEVSLSAGDSTSQVQALRPLVALLTGAGKTGMARRYLTAMAKACATSDAAGADAECVECWRTLTSEPLNAAPGADLAQAYEGLVAAIASQESRNVEAECLVRRSSMTGKMTRRITAELEATVIRDLYRASKLDGIRAQMSVDGVSPSPQTQQVLIERMQVRRSFAEVADDNADLQSQILAATLELVRSDRCNFFAYRTLLELCEEGDVDQIVVPMETVSRLWQRAAHSFPSSCDGWVAGCLGSAATCLLGNCEGSLSIRHCILRARMSWLDGDKGRAALQQGFDYVAVRKAKYGAQLRAMELELELELGQNEAARSRHENACLHFRAVLREHSASTGVGYRAACGLADSSVSLGKAVSNESNVNYLSAKTALSDILASNPQDEWALATLGEVHALCGEFEDGQQCLLRCIAFESGGTAGHKMKPAPSTQSNVAGISTDQRSCQSPYFRLAQLYWLWGRLRPEFRENKRYCHRALLQAVKHNQTCAPTFALLAELLHTVVGDVQKARRCLVKCLALSPTHVTASAALAQHLVKAGRHAEVASLCKNILARSSDVKWAWQRLGVAEQMQNQLQHSVVSLQRAVRCDTEDVLSWQELAKSYYLQGKYACATKVLERVLVSSVDGAAGNAAVYRKGRLHLLLGEVDESICLFEQLAATEWPPALVGLGDSLLRRSIVEYASGWLTRSFKTLTRAVDLLQSSVQVPQGQPQLLSAWKLLGDGLLNFSYFSTQQCTQAQNDCAVAKTKRLCDASRVYSRLVFMNPTAAVAWHDLAACTHERAKLGQVSAQTVVGLVSSAIKLAPCKVELWNLMGAIHTDPSVSQHAFIRAIQLDDKNFSAWENLGTLYLQHSQTELARQAFSESKRLNPSSPSSWTGLARVLEQLEKWEDAKFTYSQSLQLDPSQPEALRGYANCVVQLLNTDSVGSADLHSAVAYVSQYLVLRPDDAQGHNLRGIFLYQLSHAKASASAFACALEILVTGTQKDRSAAVRSCRMNLVYACCCCGDYTLAERECRILEKQESSGAGAEQLSVMSTLGWTLLMQGNLAAGCAAYATAVDLATPSSVSSISIELARVCMRLGEAHAATRSLVAGSVAVNCAQIAATLQHQPLQFDLAVNCLEELRFLVCQGDSRRPYHYLSSLFYVRMAQLQKALAHMQNVIFSNPECLRDWVILARLVLLDYSLRDRAAAPLKRLSGLCFKLKSFGMPTMTDRRSVENNCWRLCTLGRLYLLLGQDDEAVATLQRAVHFTPIGCGGRDVGHEAWTLLALSVFLTGRHLNSSSALESSIRMLSIGMSHAASAFDRCILGLASADCQLCVSTQQDPNSASLPRSIATVKATLVACEDEIETVALASETSAARCRAMLHRMSARCAAVERQAALLEISQGGGCCKNFVPSFIATYRAAAPSVAMAWRELAALLPCHAGLLSLQWSIKISPKRSEQQVLGVLQLAAFHLNHGNRGDQEPAAQAVKVALAKLAPNIALSLLACEDIAT